MAVELVVNFQEDWEKIVNVLIQRCGYTPLAFNNVTEATAYLHKIIHRLIPVKKRKVQISNEFTCPPDKNDALMEIKRKFKAGEDVNPYQSKGIKRPNCPDDMLNDWGIYHLHLGETIGTDGFAARTGPLLFIRITNDTVYLLDVMSHGDWAKEQLVQIIHDNWPETIKPFILKGVLAGPSPTEAERMHLRKAGLSMSTTVHDGTVYAPPGGGGATSRDSNFVMLRATQTISAIRQLQKIFISKQDEIINRFSPQEETSVRFLLDFVDGCACAVHPELGLKVKLASHKDTCRLFKIDFYGV